MAAELNQILKYLHPDARLDLKAHAVQNLLGLTGTRDGVRLLIESPQSILSLLILLGDKNELVSKVAALIIVNISAYEEAVPVFLDLEFKDRYFAVSYTMQSELQNIVKSISNRNSHIAEPCCMILSNLSRSTVHIEKIINLIEKAGSTFDCLIKDFTESKYKNSVNLHYLGPVLSNLSQSAHFRKYIMDQDKCVIKELLRFTEYQFSEIRRGGIIGTLRNCCFDVEHHGWLLSDKVDILPHLLLPLAGNTEYDKEDRDKLPLKLRDLKKNKKRIEDPDMRCMLLEAITLLCAKRENRNLIRDKNTYVILRELHKWEKDPKALLACENLVDILIRTEEEIGVDNLKEIEIPKDLEEKFEKLNHDI